MLLSRSTQPDGLQVRKTKTGSERIGLTVPSGIPNVPAIRLYDSTGRRITMRALVMGCKVEDVDCRMLRTVEFNPGQTGST